MADMSGIDTIWIFNGARSQFPGGVFSTREAAEHWIRDKKLTGTLTRYPLDVSAYDWAVNCGYFAASKEEHLSSSFIGKFSYASQEHYHYEDGVGGHDLRDG